MFLILRLLVFLLFTFSGYIIGIIYNHGINGVLIGGFVGLTAIATELILKKVEFGAIIGGLLGISCGLLFAYLLMLPLKPILGGDINAVSFVVMAVLGYGGLLLGLSKGKAISIASVFRIFRGQSIEENLKILDTSVIIDGRIADVCETGFLEGVFILPQFILQELQHIADASDPMKRARGRR